MTTDALSNGTCLAYVTAPRVDAYIGRKRVARRHRRHSPTMPGATDEALGEVDLFHLVDVSKLTLPAFWNPESCCRQRKPHSLAGTFVAPPSLPLS